MNDIVNIHADRTTRMLCVGADVINYKVGYWLMNTIFHKSMHVQSPFKTLCFISQLAVNITLFLCHWLNSNNITAVGALMFDKMISGRQLVFREINKPINIEY